MCCENSVARGTFSRATGKGSTIVSLALAGESTFAAVICFRMPKLERGAQGEGDA